MYLEKRISEVSQSPSGCPADLVFHPNLPVSNKLCAAHRISSECLMSHILHCLLFISNNRQTAEFSTYYLVSKVFPSVLPLCNPVSLMLTPKMAGCPDTDSTSESGALKSVPALCRYAGRCDNDLSLGHILEHSKALSQNGLQLWSTSLVLGIVLTTVHHHLAAFM